MKNSELDVRRLDELQTAFTQASVVLHKDYLGNLTDSQQAEVVMPSKWLRQQKISEISRFYHIEKLTYASQENVLEKLATVFNADYYYGGSLALVIKSGGKSIQYYIGVVNKEGKDVSTNGDVLYATLQGNFPGSELELLKNSEVESIFEKSFAEKQCRCVSAISGVASDKIEDLQENDKFVQGLEKLIDATRGQVYTLLVLADPVTKEGLQAIRAGYETLYSQLAPFEKTELTFNSTNSQTLTSGTSQGFSEAINQSITKTIGNNYSETENSSSSHTENKPGKKKIIGTAIRTAGGVAGTLGGAAVGVSAASGGTAAAPAIVGVAAISVAAGVTSAIGGLLSSYSESDSTSESVSRSKGISSSRAKAEGRTDTTSFSENKSTATAESLGQTLQITGQNRSVKSLLDKIDNQLERLTQCENFGIFNCAAYVISADPSTNHTVASTYNALMRGEESGLEASAVNTWYDENVIEKIGQYLRKGYQPEFYLQGPEFVDTTMIVTPASVVSGKELAIHMGLPKKSVPGLPVVETAEFGRNVYNPNRQDGPAINLGKIYHMGKTEDAEVKLDLQSMAMHTFITGSTGTGKSNTVYQLLDELEKQGAGFLIIEPAKGEYKHMFGNRKDVHVFGTNPYYMPLLKINPFKFPQGIHVLEHVDRLVEIFNVCWPMYAAMPAVLKDAVLRAYEASGWNLITSTNSEGALFPTFADVLQELDYVIEHSAYSSDTKGDYIGSLATRLNSLTNGLNGQIFVPDEVDNQVLFDSKTIVDLSRVGSLETKALLMGVLVMRLSEHRMVYAEGMNLPLQHVTVLEEAHNILKRTSTEQNMEGTNMAGKSVEMISNAIAEMRTYGEGFIIADQSPNAIDISAIRNTNTKIIMRLPDEEDRQLAGRSAALKDEQLDEIAKLPKGVAVVYQNDWLEPVLCKIHKYEGKEILYQYKAGDIEENVKRDQWFKQELLKLLVKGRVNEKIDVDIDKLQEQLFSVNLSTKLKRSIRDILKEYQLCGELDLWQDSNFANLSVLVTELLQCKDEVQQAAKVAVDYADMDNRLRNIIQQKSPDASSEVGLALSQCMMKRYGLEGAENLNIYAAWRDTVMKRGGQQC